MSTISLPERKPVYCGVIQQQLTVSSCPLPRGTCMWKHRLHGGCAYTTEELSAEEFSQRVGLQPLDPPVVNILRNVLKYKLQQEMTS